MTMLHTQNVFYWAAVVEVVTGVSFLQFDSLLLVADREAFIAGKGDAEQELEEFPFSTDGTAMAFSDLQFEYLRREKQYAWMGAHFWRVFATLPKSDPERIKTGKQFDSLSKREQARLEEL